MKFITPILEKPFFDQKTVFTLYRETVCLAKLIKRRQKPDSRFRKLIIYSSARLKLAESTKYLLLLYLSTNLEILLNYVSI